ncbi:MAG TPA: triose-phosphate isomerase [Actinomycetota bacterium]|nr:triose-phosphate isomerase [Actinomycetota bacterium]
MARKPIIAGNWKMFKTHLEAIALVQKLHYLLRVEDHDKVETVVCPPFTALRAVQTLIEGDDSRIVLGAQNCHWEQEGAFTGEVSPVMLARLKVQYVIAGHSERRAYFGETDEIVNKKTKAIFANGMTPIVCVGETLEQRDAGQTEEVVRAQVRGSLAGLTQEQWDRVVVAYEPVWAIGTGRNAQPSDANFVCGHIRAVVKEMGGNPDVVRIQYGGSVKPGNIRDLMAEEHVDGALVGGASLDSEDFALIVRYGD